MKPSRPSRRLLALLVLAAIGLLGGWRSRPVASQWRPSPRPAHDATADRIVAAPGAAPIRLSGGSSRLAAAPAREERFWAYDFGTQVYYQVAATLRHTSGTSHIYVETGAAVPLAAVRRLAALFEDQVYPRIRAHIGHEPEPGVDGERAITVVLLDLRDPYWHGQAPFTYHSGYFDPVNQFRQTELEALEPGTDRRSNEREMIYLDVSPTVPASRALDQTLAHEFAHLVTWSYDPDEETWLSEGLSDLAVYLCGLGHPEEHVAGFLAQPGGSLVAWSGAVADYGRAYLLLLYLGEQLQRAEAAGQLPPSAWPQSLVTDPGQGLASLQRLLGPGRPLPELLRDWAVALHLDDGSLGDGRYGFASLDLGSEAMPFPSHAVHSQFPLVEERQLLAPWSFRADRFVGGRGDVDFLVGTDGALCGAAVAAPYYSRRSGESTVLPACTDGQGALGWTFARFGPGGPTVSVTLIGVNATAETRTLDLSALPAVGGFGWGPPSLALPFLRR